jgi:hypothetical protein
MMIINVLMILVTLILDANTTIRIVTIMMLALKMVAIKKPDAGIPLLIMMMRMLALKTLVIIGTVFHMKKFVAMIITNVQLIGAIMKLVVNMKM